MSSKLIIFGNPDNLSTVQKILVREGIECELSKSLSVNDLTHDVVQYLTVGGGIISIARCITEFLKLFYQQARIKIKTEDGSEIEIESHNQTGIENLLRQADYLLIEAKQASKKKGPEKDED